MGFVGHWSLVVCPLSFVLCHLSFVLCTNNKKSSSSSLCELCVFVVLFNKKKA
ncbi:MAG: hypothetical protein F6K31_28810 [Symploca sp. SIO2G7]|nr:hypothetical protein [Symploca sp. SIO2G7]